MAFIIKGLVSDGTLPTTAKTDLANDLSNPSTPAGGAVTSAAQVASGPVASRAIALGAAGEPEALPWRAALAKRYTTPVNLVCIGTSFTEGTGAPSWRTRWQGILQTQLRAKYQPAGVTGASLPFIQAYPNAGGTITDFPVTRTGNINRATWTGLGMHTAEIIDDAAVLTFTFTGTSAALAYTKGGFGKMLVSVDGGAAVSTDMYAGSISAGHLYPITGLSAGQHTVTVTRDPTSVSGRRCPIEGLHVWNGDETRGVRVLDGGYHGADTGLYLASLASNVWAGSVKSANPSGVILDLGFNDATNGMTAETFESNMNTIIGKLRDQALFTGTVFLVSWPKRAVNTQSVWDGYTAALERVAAAQDKVVILPLIDWLPAEGAASSDPTNLGLYDGTDHPNQAGHAMIADLIGSFI